MSQTITYSSHFKDFGCVSTVGASLASVLSDSLAISLESNTNSMTLTIAMEVNAINTSILVQWYYHAEFKPICQYSYHSIA